MTQAEAYLIKCPGCGAANRIPADKRGKTAKCGKCHGELKTDAQDASPEQSFKMRCRECGAKNKIPAGKVNAGAKCGKCKAALNTDELFEPQPIMLTEANFDDKVLKSPLPVLIFAWAPW
jgi:thioredoxin 2